MLLAQELLTEPRMSNHARGLWGYGGETETGHPLTIQSTGMGGPSAAIVFHELAAAGLKRAIRVGTCGALDSGLRLADAVIASSTLAADGTSRAYGADGVAEADRRLTSALRDALPDAAGGLIASTDVFYEADAGDRQGWIDGGAIAVEMEAATLFTLGPRLIVQVACVLIVSDVRDADGRWRRIADEDLESAARQVGRAAATALEV
jgi:purine-nucleoside phosphorylase